MKHVIIMRGLPGSGKSTQAKELASGFDCARIVSADEFFVKGGRYEFDPALLPQAHAWCMRQFVCHLWDDQVEAVIVDNTNVQSWEYTTYLQIAERVGATTQIEYVGDKPVRDLTVADLLKFAQRNTHGVPFSAICAMAARWEEPDRKPSFHGPI